MLLTSRKLLQRKLLDVVLAGEAVLPPAGTAAPQAVVARDRLAQRVSASHIARQAGPAVPCRIWVWRIVRASEPGNSSFADKRRERQIHKKGVGAEG
jgi:hypothetical protein